MPGQLACRLSKTLATSQRQSVAAGAKQKRPKPEGSPKSTLFIPGGCRMELRIFCLHIFGVLHTFCLHIFCVGWNYTFFPTLCHLWRVTHILLTHLLRTPSWNKKRGSEQDTKTLFFRRRGARLLERASCAWGNCVALIYLR